MKSSMKDLYPEGHWSKKRVSVIKYVQWENILYICPSLLTNCEDDKDLIDGDDIDEDGNKDLHNDVQMHRKDYDNSSSRMVEVGGVSKDEFAEMLHGRLTLRV
jgi:hypothetical protein